MFPILRRLRRCIVSDRAWQALLTAVVGACRSCRAARVIGFFQRFQLSRDATRPGPVRSIRLPGYRYPLYYRPGTSDPHVILQVFAREEYACVGRESDVRTIVDCGANIGCTAFYFLHRYTQARVVVVEPDPANMALCRRNLMPFGDRVVYAEAGVWSVARPMVVVRGEYCDGQPWSFQVREARAEERADFTALTVPDLIRLSGRETVDILKVDIEAAESAVFRQADWLDRIRTLVIELHGAECERAVSDAFLGYTYEPDQRGELTIYRNLRPSLPTTSAVAEVNGA